MNLLSIIKRSKHLLFYLSTHIAANGFSTDAAPRTLLSHTPKQTNQIHFKVKDITEIESVVFNSLLPPDVKVEPLFTLDYDTLKGLSAAKDDLPDLTLWFRISLENDKNEEDSATALFFIYQLEKLGIDEVIVPELSPPPATTGNFADLQTYLPSQDNSIFNGIDAPYSWTFPGGNGAGVTIYDVEYGWQRSHEDLSAARDVEFLVEPGDAIDDPWPDNYHGTAVLGEMVGDQNGLGVLGISHGANVGMAPENTVMLGSARANAILLSVQDGKPGDVILLEMQTGACGGACDDDTQIGCGPAEWDQSVFEATQVAVANGFVVVATAGNGQVNLDDAACMGRFDRNIRDSGAIMVGAGGSGVGLQRCTPAREKLSFSTFGSRLDLQGWGECILTTSYGDHYFDPDAPQDEDKFYTYDFGGTSGAGPIVAAAAANIQGIAMNMFGEPLDPLEVRRILVETGTPQLGDTTQKIGPLPNLRAAIDALPSPQPSAGPSSQPSVGPSSQPSAAPVRHSSSKSSKNKSSKSKKKSKNNQGKKSQSIKNKTTKGKRLTGLGTNE